MRLISAAIENFGKLSGITIEFEEDCQIFCKENGWGKSTLAAFLCVMFYGFDGDRKRDGLANERKRYEPWQKGVYGGSITFSADGKNYLLSRSFGKKEAEDEYSLRLADSNRECTDYGADIGEELFRIDRESFRRTIFLSQQDCDCHVTDAINAKIGNLMEYGDEGNNFALAYERLKDMSNHMRPNHKKGSLSQLKDEIARLENQLRSEDLLTARMAETTSLCREQEEKSSRLQQEIARMEKRQRQLSQELDSRGERLEYKSLCDICEEEKRNVEAVAGRFARQDRIPSEEEITACQKQEKLCRELEGYVRLNTLPPQELSRCAELQGKWGDACPSEESIEAAEYANQQLLKLRKEMASPERAESRPKGRAGVKTALPAIAGLIAAAAGLGLALAYPAPGIVLAAAGMIAACLGVFAGKRKISRESTEDIRREREECARLADSVRSFLQQYGADVQAEENWASQIAGIRLDAVQMKQWKKKKEDYKKAKDAWSEQSKALEDHLQSLGYRVDRENDAEHILDGLLKNVRDYEEAGRRSKRADERRKEFESLHGISPHGISPHDISLRDMEKLRAETPAGETADGTLSDLTGKIHAAREEQKRTEQLIREYGRRLEEDRQQWDALQEIKEECREKQEQYDEGMRKYRLLRETMELLREAKDSLTVRYLQPVKDGFAKYYQMLSGMPAEDYRFDAGVNLTVMEQGMQRETKFLSAGSRDLLAICTRLALADAMYQGEKPFLILDDPFVNLDREKTERALAFLKKVSGEYQIIYFTCHESRV